MARVSFTSEIAELVGKLAGSVFQYSYGGFQVHTRVVPSNPQTNRQQLRRGWFGWFAQMWRTLTPTQQATFIAVTTTLPEAFRLFLGSNINNFLIDEGPVTDYVDTADPDMFAMNIDALSFGNLDIIAATPLIIVPADMKLLVFATSEKVLPKRFTNPSDYSPIVYFDEGSDMSSPVSILTEWENLYGVLQGTGRVCIKSALINKTNGKRGPEYITCEPPATPENFHIIDAFLNPIIDSDGTFIAYQ